MKTNRSNKKGVQKDTIEQFYIIKIERTKDNVEFLEFAFKNYSEARGMAQNIIRKKNNLNVVSHTIQGIESKSTIFREISPDLWKNIYEAISIEILKIKDLYSQKNTFKKIETRKSTEVNYSKEEIKM
jgi:hypothetical protein